MPPSPSWATSIWSKENRCLLKGPGHSQINQPVQGKDRLSLLKYVTEATHWLDFLSKLQWKLNGQLLKAVKFPQPALPARERSVPVAKTESGPNNSGFKPTWAIDSTFHSFSCLKQFIHSAKCKVLREGILWCLWFLEWQLLEAASRVPPLSENCLLPSLSWVWVLVMWQLVPGYAWWN